MARYTIFSQFNEDDEEEKKKKLPSQVAAEKVKQEEPKKQGDYKIFSQFNDYKPTTKVESVATPAAPEPEKKGFLQKVKDVYGKLKTAILGEDTSLTQAYITGKPVEKTATGKPTTSVLSDDEWAKQVGLVQ